jgi:tungstate transport system permease protein
MQDFTDALYTAAALIVQFDPELREIVFLSLAVSLTASICAFVIGSPLGAALAVFRFRGRGAFIVIANALLGLPPVVVGLVVYLLLSRSGPLGSLGILFTPTAMVIAQTGLGTLRSHTGSRWTSGPPMATPCWSMALHVCKP